jgi:hypothetical protein
MSELPVLKIEDNQITVGERAKFDNGKWTDSTGTELPRERKYMVLFTTRKNVRFHEEGPPEVVSIKPGEQLPDVNELNKKISQQQWRTGLDGKPQPPWSRWYIVVFLDVQNAQLYTHANNTYGARLATLRLEERINWKRALVGVEVAPLIQLRDAPMKTSYGPRRRPEFTIADDNDWRVFNDGQLRIADQRTSALQTVETPSLEEQLNDEIPDFSRR